MAGKGGSDAILMTLGPAQTVASSRASSRSSLARPYIWRLISLSLVICPSVWPFDQGLVIASATAARSSTR